MADKDWLRFSKYVAESASAAMKAAGITQTVLAARMGRTQQYVSHILSGKENLTFETVALLDEALELNLLKALFFRKATEDCLPPILMETPGVAYFGSGSETSLPLVHSSEQISRHFSTGDRPFLVTCDDSHRYLCKAAGFSHNSNNLARELIGTSFANIWGLTSSPMALVSILPQHLDGKGNHNYAIPCLGRQWVEDAIEISDSCHNYITPGVDTAKHLMMIALFDIWLSNEDRLTNNLNLLYSPKTNQIVAIDHAGIFNTSFSAPLLQISLYDSVVYSDLFRDYCSKEAADLLEEVREIFLSKVEECLQSTAEIWKMIPNEWGIEKAVFDAIMEYIFTPEWVESSYQKFVSIINQ